MDFTEERRGEISCFKVILKEHGCLVLIFFPVPVFVSEAGAISADPELSQELPKALFDLTPFHGPFIPDAFSTAETVAVINSGIVKSRHFPLL